MLSMYPSPWSQPTASSSSSSGVHIQVTAGRPFTSSQTAVSSTAASSDIRPPRLGGRRGSVESGTVGIQGRVLHDPHPLEGDAPRQAREHAPEHVPCDRLAGRDRALQARYVLLEVLPVEPGHHLILKDTVEL